MWLVVGTLALAGVVVAAGVAHGAGPSDQAGSPVQIVEPSATELTTWRYEPQVAAVAVGETIRWANVGAVPHAVTSRDGLFDSSLMNAGDAFAWAPPAPGVYEYICIYHPWMTGTVMAQ